MDHKFKNFDSAWEYILDNPDDSMLYQQHQPDYLFCSEIINQFNLKTNMFINNPSEEEAWYKIEPDMFINIFGDEEIHMNIYPQADEESKLRGVHIDMDREICFRGTNVNKKKDREKEISGKTSPGFCSFNDAVEYCIHHVDKPMLGENDARVKVFTEIVEMKIDVWIKHIHQNPEYLKDSDDDIWDSFIDQDIEMDLNITSMDGVYTFCFYGLKQSGKLYTTDFSRYLQFHYVPGPVNPQTGHRYSIETRPVEELKADNFHEAWRGTHGSGRPVMTGGDRVAIFCDETEQEITDTIKQLLGVTAGQSHVDIEDKISGGINVRIFLNDDGHGYTVVLTGLYMNNEIDPRKSFLFSLEAPKITTISEQYHMIKKNIGEETGVSVDLVHNQHEPEPSFLVINSDDDEVLGRFDFDISDGVGMLRVKSYNVDKGGVDSDGKMIQLFSMKKKSRDDDEFAKHVEVIVLAIKMMIMKGELPDDIGSFSQIHDHCDANMLLFDHLPVSSSDQDIEYCNKITEAVDQKIKNSELS
jgi:hypothetical protein